MKEFVMVVAPDASKVIMRQLIGNGEAFTNPLLIGEVGRYGNLQDQTIANAYHELAVKIVAPYVAALNAKRKGE